MKIFDLSPGKYIHFIGIGGNFTQFNIGGIPVPGLFVPSQNDGIFIDKLKNSRNEGWAAGAGIDLFNFIMVDFRLLGGWKEGCEPQTIGDLFNFDNINGETNTWYVSLGIMF